MVNELTMKQSILARALPISFTVVATVLLYFWLSADAAVGLKERLPIAENAIQAVSGQEQSGPLQGKLVQFDGVPADFPGAWPRFRGANFDAISSGDVRLARTWPEQGPTVLWSIDVGEGYAGAAVLAGRVYILDYDQQIGADAVRCLSLADGQEIWRYSYPVKVKRYHGMSRTVPAVTDEYVVSLGPKCHVTCLDSTTGQLFWMLDLVRGFGAKVPTWYAGQCPLIDDGKAILAVGGKSLMMAVDCQDGDIVWESPNPYGWLMTHSSAMPTEFKGTRMYVYCASGGVVGISAEDGSILWEYPEWKIRIANVPSPVIIDEERIFLSGGYNAGSMMLRLVEQGGQIKPELVYRLEPEIFGSAQQTPIFYEGYIYGVRPDGQLTCLDVDGRVVWTSTSSHQFDLGPYTIANGLIYVMNDSGVLTLVEASPAGYVQLAETKVLEGPDSWGPMAVVSGRLILRDLNRMICLDISEP